MKIESVPGTHDGIRVLKLTGPPVTLIDLSAVPYMDSASLGALLGFHVFCQREGSTR